MQTEQTTYANSSVNLKNHFSTLKQESKFFRDIFERTVNHRSNSRPPKIELRGILVPIQKMNDQNCFYKIETDQNEYFLRMSHSHLVVAKKIEWEEVTIKGYLDLDDEIFEVEKISVATRNEPNRFSFGPADPYFELDQYKRVIDQKGALEVSPDFLAS